MIDASLQKKVAIITGASRGIGKAIALKFARQGINCVVAAKTVKHSDRTPGTIYDTVQEIEAANAQALAVQTDVRDEAQIENLVWKAVERFGRIDILVNNAGAIVWRSVEDMPVRRFDLMMQINYRAPYLLAHYALPFLRKQVSAFIINLSPPPHVRGGLATETWQDRTCYLMSKFGMSHLTMGLAEELRDDNIAVNSLWPTHIIDSQATRVFAEVFDAGKATTWYSPELVAEACVHIVHSLPADLTGQMLIVEDFLKDKGITDLTAYEVPCPV